MFGNEVIEEEEEKESILSQPVLELTQGLKLTMSKKLDRPRIKNDDNYSSQQS